MNSTKCKIPALDPFDPEILPYYNPSKYINCSKLELLTHVTKEDNVAVLRIRRHLVKDYSEYGVDCCYRYVTRGLDSKDPDSVIKYVVYIHTVQSFLIVYNVL